MPLPGAFAGHFCKVLSSHEEAFFRRSDQRWAFVVDLLNLHIFFFQPGVGMRLCTVTRLRWFWIPLVTVLVT